MEIRKRKPIGKKNIKYIEELYAEFSLQENMLKMKILQKMLYRVHLRKC